MRRRFGFLRMLIPLLSGLTIGSTPSEAQDIFFAREFLMSRQFKIGRDVWPGYRATPMALHSTGIYVAGAFQTELATFPAGGGSQGYLRKYDPAGAELWTRQVGTGDFPNLLAADAASVYVAGTTEFGRDVFVARYGSDGKEVWTRRFVITAGGYHLPVGMALDGSGLYFAAWDGWDKGIVRKYSPAGDELWTRSLGVRSLGSLRMDGGAVYLAGTNDGGGFVARFAAAGDVLWTRPLETRPGEILIPGGIAADAAGVLVAGATFQRDGSDGTFFPATRKAFLRRLDSGGNEVWTRVIADTAESAISDVALDSSGIYVSGPVLGSLAGQCRAGTGDVFIRKYDAAGNEQWTRQFGTSGFELPGSLAVDASGVYLDGAIRGGAAHGTLFLVKLPKTPPGPDSGRPEIYRECVVNAAGYNGGGVAPGEIVAIFGRALGPMDLVRMRPEDGRVPTTLADTRVLFNGTPAPLLYVSATQIGAIVPYSVASQTTVDIEVERLGVRSTRLTQPVSVTRPGIFTIDGSGTGQAAIVNEDGTINSPQNPAPRGSIVSLYATGEGLTDPDVPTGAIHTTVLPTPRQGVSVWFENPEEPGTVATTEVSYAGGLPGVSGLLQVNFRAPTWVAPGSAVPLYLNIGGQFTDSGPKMAVR